MENNYCAIVRECLQVGPDEYSMITATLEIKDNTTMKQIADWFADQFPTVAHMNIVITKLEKPE